MNEPKPKTKHTIEIDEITYRRLIQIMDSLIYIFPKQAEKSVFKQLEKSGRKKVQTA